MDKIQAFLKDNSEVEYANFSRKMISTSHEIKGVRLPTLKKFARKIYPTEIKLSKKSAHEEILLCGFLISLKKTESEQLSGLSRILPFIDNWCTCDCIVCALKKCCGEKSFEFFCDLLKSTRPFDVRVAVVGLMRNFLDCDHRKEVIEKVSRVQLDDHYVQMAKAWLYAELCCRDFENGVNAIKNERDEFVRRKAISKCCDSYKLSIDEKKILKALRA